MNPDALVFRGQEGTGQAQVFNNTAYQMARQAQQDVLANDLRKAALIDQKMQAGLQNIDVKLDGMDVDTNGQLLDMQEDIRNYFINSWRNQIDPSDPKNREVWREMQSKVNKLKGAVQASKHQEAIYFENLRKLNSDKGKNFDTKKSMENLEKYRNASIEERERMGLDILVQRDVSAQEIFTDVMKDYGWSPTKGLPTYRDEDGNFRQVTWKEMPMEQMKQAVANKYLEDTREGEAMRNKYETVNDALAAFEKTIPDPVKFERFSKKGGLELNLGYGFNPKKVPSYESRQKTVDAIVDDQSGEAIAMLKGAKYKGKQIGAVMIETNEAGNEVLKLQKTISKNGMIIPIDEYWEINLSDTKKAKVEIWQVLNSVEDVNLEEAKEYQRYLSEEGTAETKGKIDLN